MVYWDPLSFQGLIKLEVLDIDYDKFHTCKVGMQIACTCTCRMLNVILMKLRTFKILIREFRYIFTSSCSFKELHGYTNVND